MVSRFESCIATASVFLVLVLGRNCAGEGIVIAPQDVPSVSLALRGNPREASRLAAQRLRRVAIDELGLTLSIHSEGVTAKDRVVALCGPWGDDTRVLLRQARVEINESGRLKTLARKPSVRAEQGFVAARQRNGDEERLVLAADTDVGMRNALLTLSDRLYRDAQGNVVVDPFDGTHIPVFDARHIKTDAMNGGPFRHRFEYWDPASDAGVDQFAGWLASYRITDYALLAFVRGWGLSYRSERFPKLSDPQHPNVEFDYYPKLIERLHAWGVRVWASDVYIASGYTMEVGTVPEMLSPRSDPKKLRPFQAGAGAFYDILGDREAVVCLSHPKAAEYYANVVDELLTRYPNLDGLDFHIGHTFSANKICRCPRCKDLRGNREGIYQCFRQAYRSAVSRNPNIRIRVPFKMFGDATQCIVEHFEEFPRMEVFCWLRWVGNLGLEGADVPVTTGHEDGGGGLEANHDPTKTITQLRDYHRDFEAVIRHYVFAAQQARLASISWEPVFQRELDQIYFCYSQLTWEPQLSWAELARRYVVRSERRIDEPLIEAYRLALEANAAMTHWGLLSFGPGIAQWPMQKIVQPDIESGLMREVSTVQHRRDVQRLVAALGKALKQAGLLDRKFQKPPVDFDLRWSLVKTYRRMMRGESRSAQH